MLSKFVTYQVLKEIPNSFFRLQVSFFCHKRVGRFLRKFVSTKSMVICIYRQRQQFIVLDNVQQCYIIRPIRAFSGISVKR